MIHQFARALVPAVLVTGAILPIGAMDCGLRNVASGQEINIPDSGYSAEQPQYTATEIPARLSDENNIRPVTRIINADKCPKHEPWMDDAPDAADMTAAPGGRYPQLDASMYPCPQPNIPIGTGMTMITNPAFAPHEMLYPHCYKSMFPPYYYRVKGFWYWTPFGMKSVERWELQGTQVKVKYSSKLGLFSGFSPPTFGYQRPYRNYYSD